MRGLEGRTATVSFHCQAGLHLLCPGDDDQIMACICACHDDNTTGDTDGIED